MRADLYGRRQPADMKATGKVLRDLSRACHPAVPARRQQADRNLVQPPQLGAGKMAAERVQISKPAIWALPRRCRAAGAASMRIYESVIKPHPHRVPARGRYHHAGRPLFS